MQTLNVSYTEPVNQTGTDLAILTREQVWKGLELKARRPQDFIPSFDDSRVIEEDEDRLRIVRLAHVSPNLTESPLAGRWVKEECTFIRPVMTCFNVEGSSTIRNIISSGPDGSLYLTFTYEWEENTKSGHGPEASTEAQAYGNAMKIAVSSVKGTIKTLRLLAERGDL